MNRPPDQGERWRKEMIREENARQNPLYGVMLVGGFATVGADPKPGHIERFSYEGRRKAATWLLPRCAANSTARDARIMGFGCGIGRLADPVLAQHPDAVEVHPCRTKLRQSTALAAGAGFRVIQGGWRSPVESATVHRAFSCAVLQYISPLPVIANAIPQPTTA